MLNCEDNKSLQPKSMPYLPLPLLEICFDYCDDYYNDYSSTFILPIFPTFDWRLRIDHWVGNNIVTNKSTKIPNPYTSELIPLHMNEVCKLSFSIFNSSRSNDDNSNINSCAYHFCTFHPFICHLLSTSLKLPMEILKIIIQYYHFIQVTSNDVAHLERRVIYFSHRNRCFANNWLHVSHYENLTSSHPSLVHFHTKYKKENVTFQELEFISIKMDYLTKMYLY